MLITITDPIAFKNKARELNSIVTVNSITGSQFIKGKMEIVPALLFQVHDKYNCYSYTLLLEENQDLTKTLWFEMREEGFDLFEKGISIAIPELTFFGMQQDIKTLKETVASLKSDVEHLLSANSTDTTTPSHR